MRRRTILAAAACAAALPASAVASSWPVVGGDGARSGSANADPGETPIEPAWSVRDDRVRTSIVITGGGGPDVQRVAYGTATGRLHLRILADGRRVTPEEGVDIESGSGLVEGGTWGTGNHGAAFADTSTEDRLGQLLVPHNDQNAVYVAKVDLASGKRIGEDLPVPSTLGCTTSSPPVITPPDAAGGRLLYFVITGSCVANTSLVRVPILGDATAPSAGFGTPTFAPVNGTPSAAPALMVLRSADGAARYHVAVPVTGGLAVFGADQPLSGNIPPSAVPPAITATFPDPADTAQTPSGPVTAAGLLPGAEGSGTGPSPVVTVPALSHEGTRVYRFVQDGPSAQLRLTADSKVLPNSGRPGPAVAISETVAAAGLDPGGLIVVPSETNLTLLRAADLTVAAQLSPVGFPVGRGFRFTAPVVSGRYVYVARDGAPDVASEHLVLRLEGLGGIGSPEFAASGSPGPGAAYGQPAVARGLVVVASPAGVVAYRNRDVTPPAVELEVPEGTLGRADALTARVRDARGVQAVTFRLAGGRTLGREQASDTGSAYGDTRFSLSLAALDLPAGEHQVEAVAVDRSGLSRTSAPRRVRVSGIGSGGLPKGACARTVTGSRRADRIRGSARGDRIVGGAGDDRLDGAGGHDCVLGQAGDDVLAGGAGDDLLEGSGGSDVLAGGRGRNRLSGGAAADILRGGRSADRLSGGAGNDIVHGGGGHNRLSGGSGADHLFARNRRRDVISCGPGRDRVTADRVDVVARDCERVLRR